MRSDRKRIWIRRGISGALAVLLGANSILFADAGAFSSDGTERRVLAADPAGLTTALAFASSRNYGSAADDAFLDAAYTADGGVIAVGTTSGNGTSYGDRDWSVTDETDGWIVKYDSLHAIEWTRTFDPTPERASTETLSSVAVLSDGRIAVCGTVSDTTGVADGTIAGSAAYIAVYDPSAENYEDRPAEYYIGGPAGSLATGAVAVEAASDGGFVVGGSSAQSAAVCVQVQNGSVTGTALPLWQAKTGTGDLPKHSDGGGTDSYILRFAPSAADGPVPSFCALENYYDSETAEGAFYNKRSELHDLALDASDNIYLVGAVSADGVIPENALIAKVDASGTRLWHRSAGYVKSTGAAVSHSAYDCVTVLADGSIVAVGSSDDVAATDEKWEVTGLRDIVFVRYAPEDGKPRYSENIGTIEYYTLQNITDVVADADGGFLLAGFRYGIVAEDALTAKGYDWGNYGDADAVIIKYNASNQVLWSENYGTSEEDCIQALCIGEADGETEVLAVGASKGAKGNPVYANLGETDAVLWCSRLYEAANTAPKDPFSTTGGYVTYEQTETVPSLGTDTTHNDMYWKLQAYDMESIHAGALPENGYTGKGVKVAVIDTGLTANSRDLDYARILSGYDYLAGAPMQAEPDADGISYTDENGRGTALTGLLAAVSDNKIGIAGMLGEVSVIPLRVSADEDSVSAKLLAQAIRDAADEERFGADVILTGFPIEYEPEASALKTAVDQAAAKGVIILAPASENGAAAEGSFFAVGTGNESYESVQVTAPADSVVSLGLSGSGKRCVLRSGAAYAAARVAALAAAGKQTFPGMDAAGFRQLLQYSCTQPESPAEDDISAGGDDASAGEGETDAGGDGASGEPAGEEPAENDPASGTEGESMAVNYGAGVIDCREFLSDLAIAQDGKINLKSASVSAIEAQTYTGEALTPEFTVTVEETVLIPGTDVNVEFSDNTDAGPAGITITGIGEYRGTIVTGFDILQASNAWTSGLTCGDVDYGSEPAPQAQAVFGEVEYSYAADPNGEFSENCPENVGTYYVKAEITETENYTGLAQVDSFQVLRAENYWVKGLTCDSVDFGEEPVADADPKFGEVSFTYAATSDGLYRDAVPTVAGSYYVRAHVEGTSNYAGLDAGPFAFTIAPLAMKDAEITLAKETYAYTGKKMTPAVTVEVSGETLKAGQDYTLVYNNNKDVGKATVTVTGTGNYTGTATAKFSIALKKGTSFTVNKITYKVTNASKKYVTVTGTKVTSGRLVIPDTVSIGGQKCSVTAISAKACFRKTEITSVSIGDNVTSIGASAFQGCKKLAAVKIGKAVATIGTKAFFGDKKLYTVKLTCGNKLKKVGASAWKGIHEKAVFTVSAKNKSTYNTAVKRVQKRSEKTVRFRYKRASK